MTDLPSLTLLAAFNSSSSTELSLQRLDLSPAHRSYPRYNDIPLLAIARDGPWQNLTMDTTVPTGSSLKAAWYRYLDETARANAGAPRGSCCSSPTKVYTQRRKG